MANTILDVLIKTVPDILKPFTKTIVDENEENSVKLFGPVTFRVDKPDNIKGIIKHLKTKLGKHDNISGDDKSGEFHVGFTNGRYTVKDSGVFITITNKFIFYSYPRISCTIRDMINDAKKR